MERWPQNNQVPANQPARPAEQPKAASSRLAGNTSKGSKKKLWLAIAIVIIVLAILGGVWCYVARGGSQVNGSKYQAVFLSNGQVYFGKLHEFYGERPYLTDVYYIQAQNSTSTDPKAAGQTNQQLVKLGGEIHGPENEMILNKSSILFVENLTDNSKVVKLIQGGGASTNSGTQQPQQ